MNVRQDVWTNLIGEHPIIRSRTLTSDNNFFFCVQTDNIRVDFVSQQQTRTSTPSSLSSLSNTTKHTLLIPGSTSSLHSLLYNVSYSMQNFREIYAIIYISLISSVIRQTSQLKLSYLISYHIKMTLTYHIWIFKCNTYNRNNAIFQITTFR